MKLKLTMIAAVLLMLQSGGAHAANLESVRTGKHPNFTRIVFEFQNATQFRAPVIYGEGEFSLAFPDSTTVLPRRIFYKTTQSLTVRSIEFSQQKTLLTAVIKLSFPYFKLKAFSLPNPNRVVIDAYLITPPPSEIVLKEPAAKESTLKEPAAKESKLEEPAAKESTFKEPPAKELALKELKVIPERSPVKQTGDKFQIKKNDALDITQDQLKDPTKKSLNKVSAAVIKTKNVPDEPAKLEQIKLAKLLPSADENYNLQIYLLILLNFLTIVIVLLLSFDLLKKKIGINSKHVDKIFDSVKTVDQGIAAVDAMINEEFKKHD